MDAHHLLPWWDHGVIPTHMSTIYKKQKATLIVLSGPSVSLAGRLHLGPEIGSAVSLALGKKGYYRSRHSRLESTSQ